MSKNQIPKIDAQSRDQLGSVAAKRLRDAGRMPAVVYGHKQDPVHVSVDRKEMTGLLHDRAHLVELSLKSGAETCLIKDVQWDHLGSRVQHIDLTRVDRNERVQVEVELELFGEPVGLKESGTLLEHPLNTLEVECLAMQIPERIRVDVSGLGVDESITVADVTLPDGVTAVTEPSTIIAVVHHIAIEEDEEEGAEATAEGQEPEVVGKKDKPEDGDD